jgi:hypothetical protein
MQHARRKAQGARQAAGEAVGWAWAGMGMGMGAGGGLKFCGSEVLKLAWGGICREHDGAQTALDRRRRPWQSSATSSRGALYMSSTPSPTHTPKPSLPPLLPP